MIDECRVNLILVEEVLHVLLLYLLQLFSVWNHLQGLGLSRTGVHTEITTTTVFGEYLNCKGLTFELFTDGIKGLEGLRCGAFQLINRLETDGSMGTNQ